MLCDRASSSAAIATSTVSDTELLTTTMLVDGNGIVALFRVTASLGIIKDDSGGGFAVMAV